jgi:hypothetical protein
MNPRSNFWIDASVAGGLLAAVLLVIGLDAILPGVKSEEPVPKVITQIEEPPPPPANPLRLAVTPVYVDKKGQEWDNMAKLLDNLGEGYRYTQIPTEQLLDSQRLKEYDVLFFTCGFQRDYRDLAPRLRDFVDNGGTLYASDWRYDAVAAAFPEYRDPRLEADGLDGTIMARVVDPGLRDVLKDNLRNDAIPLRFNLDHWKPAAFSSDRGHKVTVLLQGTYKKQEGGKATAPLLVKFQHGKGTVIFTSFHNEKQNNDIETKLLKYLVFSAVTAKVEAQIAKTMIQGGFSPQKSNLLSASPGDPKVTQTYQCKKPGRLRFELGFENRGARLQLTLVSPHGKKYEKEGTATFAIEVPDAPAGHWEYTVRALEVPYQNFPFQLIVGESDK